MCRSSHKPESKEQELELLIYDVCPVFSARFEVMDEEVVDEASSSTSSAPACVGVFLKELPACVGMSLQGTRIKVVCKEAKLFGCPKDELVAQVVEYGLVYWALMLVHGHDACPWSSGTASHSIVLTKDSSHT
eukprot:scaffold130091_cov20-Tisochrysis_lutea.AAC.1